MSQHGSQTRPVRPSALRRVSRPIEQRFPGRGRNLRSSPVRVAGGQFRVAHGGAGSLGKPLAMRSMKTFVIRVSPLLVRSHASGLFRRPAALGLLLRLRTLRVSVPPKGRPPKKQTCGTWEPGLSLRLRQWVTRPIREFNNGDFTMYQNRISLIGFLGKDATAVTTNNANFTTLSLATKSSYKDKTTGKYIDHTEWHRCIVWGKLAEYTKTLKKGAHLSVEGELRSRERTDKKTDQKERVWEVRVTSILKLDRAEKAGPEETTDAEFNPEEEAA